MDTLKKTTLQRSSESKTLHDAMVEAWASHLRKEGWEVKADIDGYTRPSQMGEHIPDIVAVAGGRTIIGEVETCDSISLDHTKSQYQAFSAIYRAEFHVLVPESCLQKAQEQADAWHIVIPSAHWWKYLNH